MKQLSTLELTFKYKLVLQTSLATTWIEHGSNPRTSLKIIAQFLYKKKKENKCPLNFFVLTLSKFGASSYSHRKLILKSNYSFQ